METDEAKSRAMEGRFPRADARGIFYDLAPPMYIQFSPSSFAIIWAKVVFPKPGGLRRPRHPGLCVANKTVARKKIGQVWALQNFRSKKYSTFPDKRTHLFPL